MWEYLEWQKTYCRRLNDAARAGARQTQLLLHHISGWTGITQVPELGKLVPFPQLLEGGGERLSGRIGPELARYFWREVNARRVDPYVQAAFVRSKDLIEALKQHAR